MINKHHVQFGPNEISTPVSTFVITDTLGNEIKVTQVETENFCVNVHDNVSTVKTEEANIFQHQPSLNISIQSDDESSVDASEMEITDTAENAPELPIPKKCEPVTTGSMAQSRRYIQTDKTETFVHNEVPPGD